MYRTKLVLPGAAVLVLVLLLMSVFVGQAGAAPLYTVTNLGTLGGNVAVATGINSSGQVTGYSTDASGNANAFLYSRGSITRIGSGGCCSAGLGINDNGQVVGTTSSDGGITYQAALFAGNSTTIVVPPSSLQNAAAVGISNAGDIAVTASQGNNATSFVVHNGVFTNVGSIGGPLASAATSMNSAGIVTGWSGLGSDLSDFRHGFIYQNGTLTDLGNLGGNSRNSIAEAANASGGVTGVADNSSRTADVAFYYSNGEMMDLGAGCGQATGYGINNYAVVVGAMSCGVGTSAFLYQTGSMYNLNNLISPSDPLFGTVDLVDAVGITDSGQIIAEGCVGSIVTLGGTKCIGQLSLDSSPSCLSGDQCAAYLLTPVGVAIDVAEPSSFAGFGTGLVFLGFLSTRMHRFGWAMLRMRTLKFRSLSSAAS